MYNDERMKYVSDMIVGARTLKCYGWENFYLEKLGEARKKQLSAALKQNMISIGGFTIFQNVGFFLVATIFTLDWSKGKLLDPSESMTMLAMIYYLFFSVNTLTFALLTTMQTFLAIIDRLGNVLEMDEYVQSRTEDGVPENTKIVMKDASFTWGFRAKTLTEEEKKARAKQRSYRVELDEVEDNVVDNLNIDMKQGDMMMVVGQVGCGKSSLLHAIMGELKKTAGTSDINGTIAYVEQEPFIYSASVLDNIIFGNPYDSEKF